MLSTLSFHIISSPSCVAGECLTLFPTVDLFYSSAVLYPRFVPNGVGPYIHEAAESEQRHAMGAIAPSLVAGFFFSRDSDCIFASDFLECCTCHLLR